MLRMRFLVPLLPLFALAPSAVQAGAPEHILLTDVFQIRTVADPQISPDGKRIVYMVNLADIKSDTRYSNLWLINFDGSGNRPITSGNSHDSSPRWSPDGTRIAFISDRDGSTQIYQYWPDRGETARLTDLTESPGGISWSPDGQQIAFMALVPDKPLKLGDLPSPPAGAHWAEPPRIIDKLVYRFNGAEYLKPGKTQLFVVSAEGGMPRQISPDQYTLGGPSQGGNRPVWTPDGKSVILSANRHPNAEFDPLNTDIYEFPVAGGAVKELTTREGPDSSPTVSRDGSHIAYTGFDDRHQGYQVTQLYVMRSDGTESRPLVPDLDRDVENPEWGPDGKGVYFLYADQGDTKLGYAPLDGKFRQIADHLGSTVSAYGGGDAFSVAADGRFVTTVASPESPGDLATGTLDNAQDGGGVTSITHVNQGLLAQRKLGQVEQFWYNSSKDDRRIEGWIIKPPDFDPARKYPLILEIHGGPFANYGDRFDFEKQAFAANGFVVLYVNPRGSTSYGGVFGNLIHHAYPGDDFYDLNSGVDAVIAKGYVDPANLFVTGGSGGGVLTCWMIEHSTRFRAAASLYPVINWYSWIGTADIGPRLAYYWFAGPPWENAATLENYVKRSPISYIGNVKTPTLLMTGEEDYRTPIEEAEQFYSGLKLQKVQTVLVRMPGEPHGLSRRPSHQMAKVEYIVDWFNQHKSTP